MRSGRCLKVLDTLRPSKVDTLAVDSELRRTTI